MKKYIFLQLLVLAAAGIVRGQVQPTAAENYLYTKTCLSADCTRRSETVTYYDGLARPKQNILLNATPQGKDIVSKIEYDGYGRQAKTYLPLPQQGSQNGAIYTNPDASFYGSEKIYSENKFEDFPRARLTESYPQGTAWADKPNRYTYGTNAANEVKMYVAQTSYSNTIPSTTLVQTVNYPAATLDKVTVTDADLNPVTEYRNGKGQTIMVRKNDGTQNTDTYYVYDNYGRLSYVIPPLASASALTSAITDTLCYQYLYDTKGRQIAKRLPGKGWEYMVYDKADRLILTQDAVMNAKAEWLITKYDAFGRVAYTGTLTGGDRATRQNEINNSVVTESRSSTAFTRNGMTVYYTENSLPASAVLSVNYYDTYPEGSPAGSSHVLGQNVLPQDPQTTAVNTRSLPVASYIKNIENDNWTKNYTWYDSLGRSIATYSINHLGGYTKAESLLDFAGMVQQTVTRHKRLNADPEKVVTQTFEYDSQNRLLVHKHQVDSNPVEILVQNSYNAISQLSNKKVGNNLQSIDYAYNIRGWMTRINDPSGLNGKLFGYEVKYTDPLNTSASAKYNGNIAEVNWKTSTDGVYRRYNYTYDALNRLLQGTYSEPYNSVTSNNYFNESISYDSNGNIKTLKRFSRPSSGTIAEKIDDLVYNYENSNLSNRLASISLPAGVANNASGYNALGYTIGYDANGNMTSQQDKGISAIQYNLLNLSSVMTTAQGTISYTYAADGTKLRKSATSKTIDYLNGFQYETSQSTTSLQFVPTAEGYFDFVKNKYIYSYKDHLGNVRLSYFRNTNGSAEVLEENNYYPFGLKHEGYNALAGNNSYQYKYNGVEMQTESGMYAMDWRNYMPELGRFSTIDMLAESYNDSTPYHFASNNPVFYSDPTGMYTNTHSGYLFTDTAEIAALQQYFGNGGSVSSLGGFMSGNETFKEDIPELTINVSKWHYALTGDYLTNNDKKTIFNHLNKYIGVMSTFTQWDGDRGFWGNWADSDNFWAGLSYSIVNNFYLGLQMIDTFDWLGTKNISGYNGRITFSNLDDSSQFDSGNRLMAFATTFNPFGPKMTVNVPATFGAVGESVLPQAAFRMTDELAPLSASQFSKLFKGTTIARATPATRGLLNRYLNKGLNGVNSVGLYRTLASSTAKALAPYNDHNNR